MNAARETGCSAGPIGRFHEAAIIAHARTPYGPASTHFFANGKHAPLDVDAPDGESITRTGARA